MEFDRNFIFGQLRRIKDPEIPVVDIVELGIVRDARLVGGVIHVDITPTYSGCPAMRVIEDEIIEVLRQNFPGSITVNKVYSPPWTSAWLSSETKEKFRRYGIAPPGNVCGIEKLVALGQARQPVACPHCGKSDCELRSEYSSTACKALYFCGSCKEPFEYFKEI